MIGTERKVVLVTGASAGIGKAVVRRMLGDGWRVYGAARRIDQMADIAGAGAAVLHLDLTDDASMQATVAAVVAKEGRIDALVNNAGYGAYGAVEDVPLADARRQFEVNVFALARMAQLVLPHMRRAGRGRIVNISSMGGRIWTTMGGWYHATKHAVEVLSDAMRVETRPFGIQVVVVQPGAISTEWGAISASNLRATAAGSAYAEQIESMSTVLDGGSDLGASPDVVARAVARALNSARPRRRYATPLDARAMIFLRWLLPEWAWERMMLTSLRMLSFVAQRRAQPEAR